MQEDRVHRWASADDTEVVAANEIMSGLINESRDCDVLPILGVFGDQDIPNTQCEALKLTR